MRHLSPRVLVLPSQGRLLISTDLHGNLDDFQALRRRFERALDDGEDVHWALLGDLVHGPDEETAQREPRLYGFSDESPALIDALFELRSQHPRRVHVLLGNHDAGHVGLRRTSKFHPDEVEALERRLTPGQRERLDALFGSALLLALAPCGLVLAHGSPGEALESLELLDGPLPPVEPRRRAAVNELLWSYGQRGEVTAALLARLSAETGLALRVVVHGHDRDEAGWFVEGDNQVQPVIFGAPRERRRCLWVDLGARVESPAALREGQELRLVHSAD
ncbi:MAG: metallophosphoesterase [Myxococcota bacterium]